MFQEAHLAKRICNFMSVATGLIRISLIREKIRA